MAYGAILGHSQNQNTVSLDNSSLTTWGGTAFFYSGYWVDLLSIWIEGLYGKKNLYWS